MRRVAVAVAVAAGLAVPAASAEDPLQAARRAATTLRFGATVVVQWVDGTGVHEATTTVRSDQGSVEARDLQWSNAALLEPPAMDAKYDLRTGPGAVVAGRPTTTVDVLSGGRLRERLALDRETNLVLERVQFDAAGHVVRAVRIKSLTLLPAEDLVVPPPAVAPAELPARYRAPNALAAGYQRVATYRRGAIAQVVYSDGLHSLSVFMQPGRLDPRTMPEGVMWVALGRRTGAVHSWPGGVTVTWEAGGVVYTAVGDGPVDDVVGAAASVPPPAAPSLVGEARRRARAVVETLVGSA